MLSSQTKDEVTASAMSRLKDHGLNIKNIISTPQNDIEDLIKPVGFYRVSKIFSSLAVTCMSQYFVEKGSVYKKGFTTALR